MLVGTVEIHKLGLKIITAVSLVGAGVRRIWISIHGHPLLDDPDASTMALRTKIGFRDSFCLRLRYLDKLFDEWGRLVHIV